jgi:hypothetical protein
MGSYTTLSQRRFICRTQETPRSDRVCLELARRSLGARLRSPFDVQAPRGTLSRTDPTPRGKFQTWILGLYTTPKKDRVTSFAKAPTYIKIDFVWREDQGYRRAMEIKDALNGPQSSSASRFTAGAITPAAWRCWPRSAAPMPDVRRVRSQPPERKRIMLV